MTKLERMKKSLVIVCFALVSLIWGSTYFGIRVALEAFPPFLTGAVRFVGAGALIFAIARARGEALPSADEWRSAAVTGALFFVVGNGMVNVAEGSVSSGLTAVMVATMPLWALLFSRWAGERVATRELVGIAVGLGGVILMNLGAELRANRLGALAALSAPVGWALGSVASKRMRLAPGTMRVATQMLAGGAFMTLLSAALGEHVVAPVTPRAVGALIYLCIFGSLLGFSAYSYLLANVRASVATSYAYVNPVIALAIGTLLGGERLEAASALGAFVVIASVAVVAGARWRGTKPARPVPLRTIPASGLE